jgi:GSH-dependent disulfide-bond oxidoreductase
VLVVDDPVYSGAIAVTIGAGDRGFGARSPAGCTRLEDLATMIDLYAAATINGRRAALAAAECGLAYRLHRLDLAKGDQRQPDFLAINPNGTIPVLVDDDGPDGRPITIVQSGAIVLYCAEKSGQLIPRDPRRRIEAFAWFMQAITDAGPASSILFQLSLAPEPGAVNADFFTQRFLKACANVDRRLDGRDYLAEEFSIADIALYPIIKARSGVIDRATGLGHLKAWERRMAARQQIVMAIAANG